MINDYKVGYLNGIMNMSSTLSDYMGPSNVEVLCYKKDNFIEEIAKDYKINKDKIEIIKTNNNLEEKLKEFYGDDKKIIASLLYYLNKSFKNIDNIYNVNDYLINKLSGSDNTYCVFYIVEDIFILESNNYYYLFILGNFE